MQLLFSWNAKSLLYGRYFSDCTLLQVVRREIQQLSIPLTASYYSGEIFHSCKASIISFYFIIQFEANGSESSGRQKMMEM